MGTRGNYVFIDYPVKQVGENEWKPDAEAIVNLKLGISNDTECIKRGNKVYVHWDNYPSYALPTLFEFLHLKGAVGRKTDKEYLSAWFVAYKTVGLNETFTGDCDFTGVGLENYLNDWCDYTYVILPDAEGFRIFIYDYHFNFIDEIHSDDDLEELAKEEWWY